MPTIKRSENAIIDRLLYYSNGTTELPLSSLTYLSAEIIQYGAVKGGPYVLIPTPDPVQAQIEEGDSTNEVRVHLTEEISTRLKEGAVTFRLKMKKANTEYTDTYQYDIDEHSPFSVTL